MSKLIVPVPSEFPNYREFFKSLISLNKEKKTVFSFRHFSKRTGWPVSYLNEIVKGRKKLSVMRALQFSKSFDLNPLQSEQLIQWVVTEAMKKGPEKVFYQEQVELQDPSRIETEQFQEEKEFFTPLILGVFDVLHWLRGKGSALQIKKSLYLYPDLTSKEVERILEILEKKEVIRKIKKNQYEFVVKNLFWYQYTPGEKAFEIQKMYNRNYVRWLDSPKGPAFYTSGTVEIAKKDFQILQKKLVQLQNQMITLSNKTSAKERNPDEETELLQFGWSLFPAAKKP